MKYRHPIERVVRPFETKKSIMPTPTRVPVDEPAPDEEEPPAFLEWGRGSAFQTDMPSIDPVLDMNADGYVGRKIEGAGFTTASAGSEYTPDRRSVQDDECGCYVFDEMDRCTQRATVWNPEDNTQWVVVERVLSMRFRGPQGGIYKFNFRPPPMPPKPKDAT